MKVSAYHKARGYTVDWWNGFEHYDTIYMSKVFTDEYSPDVEEPYNAEMIIKGGTGYGLGNALPAEVEHQYPDYSLYPAMTNQTAYGFLSRGCPRACGFCIVAEKEGRKSVKVADLCEFWRGQKTIKLLDPNLLACADYAALLHQLIESKAWVDFTQGLDIRLTTADNVELLRRVRVKQIHFAWDNPQEDLTGHFERFKQLSGIADYRKLGVYVLTNYNSTHDEDLYRIETLRDLGYSPYVMIYDKQNAPRETRLLQRWVNNKFIWRSCERFEDYNPSIA
jgi:hypothetical protein